MLRFSPWFPPQARFVVGSASVCIAVICYVHASRKTWLFVADDLESKAYPTKHAQIKFLSLVKLAIHTRVLSFSSLDQLPGGS
jgi:hypothetical protein